MSKIFHVARREFAATALTKGFIIGAFIVPAVFAAAIPLIIILTMGAKAPTVEGTMAVIDRSGQVGDSMQSFVDGQIEQNREEIEEAVEQTQELTEQLTGQASPLPGPADAMLENAIGPDPEISVELLAADTDEEAEKARLRPSAEGEGGEGLLALAVIDEDAVLKPEDQESFGSYQVFVRPKLDDRVIDTMRDAVREAVREARYTANGYDPAEIAALTRVRGRATKEISETGEERGSMEALTMMLPVAFMILLMMSVMIGGQYLLTTTVEEKSSRVVELLLSATSPMQLMTGKIIGQMCVGLTLLTVYSGIGIGALVVFSLGDILPVSAVVYLFIFFILAYFMIASLLAAVGSAVNDMREAQSLQTPVMLLIMIPYILWLPISRDPNSTFATVLSFIPPVSPFVMMMRMTSSQASDIPFWQPILSVLVGIVGAYCCVWAAAKVFRVGLLMYGKPPNFRTLVKWVRMA